MRCSAITGAGSRCKLEANHGSSCFSHNPATAEERKRRARKGGKAGGNGRRSGVSEISGIKALLSELTERVLSGDLETGRAAVANQLQNTKLRAVEIERKARESEDLEARIEALERNANKLGGKTTWRQA